MISFSSRAYAHTSMALRDVFQCCYCRFSHNEKWFYV